jgi:alpha-L-arabinofuranosidase
MSTRRDFIKAVGVGAAALAMPRGYAKAREAGLTVNPEPRFALSPYLYMQFMEPLGVTDGSVAAAWDFKHDRWRGDVIEATKRLGAPMVRWGGCLASYYKWREGVGPRDERKPFLNLCWNGIDTNQVGTREFVEFCRLTGADPLMCVNFESDGKSCFARTPKGEDRIGYAKEAFEWVRYCNDPECRERIDHGSGDPLTIKMWQIGNETSYGQDLFDLDGAAMRTVEFAKAMRKADPSIELIGWGDSGWARRMVEIAGEHLQYIAFHHMFNPDRDVENSPLRGVEYRKDPAWTWERLMNAAPYHERRVKSACDEVAGLDMPLALTECHFALPGRNRCEVLSTWAAGVANARLLNIHERYGETLKIATLADFCGTRWQVNAMMIPVPWGEAFLQPVGQVMRLYRSHVGERFVDVTRTPDHLDVTASRTGDTVFLHVVNTDRNRKVPVKLEVEGMKIASGRVFEMAADPMFEVMDRKGELEAKEHTVPAEANWTFPPASVSAVELDVSSV